MAALVGTAGLASLRGEDSCSDRFTREESSTVQASQALSLWPPGVACQLIPDDGHLVDEVDRSAWGFLALVTLEIGLIAGVVRSPTTIPLALRTASIATAGLPLGALAACGSARSPARRCRSSISRARGRVRRRSPPVPHGPQRQAPGRRLLGLVLAPASTVLGLFVWAPSRVRLPMR